VTSAILSAIKKKRGVLLAGGEKKEKTLADGEKGKKKDAHTSSLVENSCEAKKKEN